MKIRSGTALLFFIAGAAVASAQTVPSAKPVLPASHPSDNGEWKEVRTGEFDTRVLTARGKELLAEVSIGWHHAQTEHFVVHFEQAIFARKVARMAEFFYTYIAQDLKGVTEHIEGRSHIFVFRSEKRWGEFRKEAGVAEWVFSEVEGTCMFLQQADDTHSSGDILAHETTHLVMNRFFTARPPLWLNEGLAEYYGEFAYSAYKGVKKSKRAQFTRLGNPFPMENLLYAATYPTDEKQVRAFYETAKYLVAFLLLDRPQEQFLPFLEDLLKGTDVVSAFTQHYGLSSVAQIEKGLKQFSG